MVTVKREYPTCEICGQNPATSFSWFQNRDDETGLAGQWKFVCGCSSGIEDYYIEFDRFFRDPTETAAWIDHLQGKTWMDWRDFTGMMARFEQVSRGSEVA